jgi:GNAT superfamily N-acetyltransferase
MTTVRRAQAVDRAAVVETVVAAFRGDPGWGFIFGDDFERLAPHFAGALFDVRLATDTIWVTDDLSAAALWAPPGRSAPPELADQVWSDYRTRAGEVAWQRLEAYDAAVERCHPTVEYWYLGVLATHPSRQGEGLASAVMGPALAQADRDGLAACLETSTTNNRDFYARRGFTRAVEVALAGGPSTWWLTRAPAATGSSHGKRTTGQA